MPANSVLFRLLALTTIALVLLAGCAGSDTAAEDESTDPVATDSAAGASADDGANTDADAGGDAEESAGSTTDTRGVEVSEGLGEKPSVELPGGEPPEELVVVDIVEGDGEEVPAGATVTTHYVGVSWLNDGAEFDSSWDRGQPATFGLGQVIAGWTEGIPGMQVGGRRLLIIPPDQAYGPSTPSPDIAPNDTLVFVIDLVEVTR